MKVCICGGGNLAHAFAGELTQNPNIKNVTVITRRPKDWEKSIKVYRGTTFNHSSEPTQITDDYSVIKNADFLIITVPCHARKECFDKISQYLTPETIIIIAPAVGGIHYLFKETFPKNKFVALQRIPYICRTIEYGKSVNTMLKDNIDVLYSSNFDKNAHKIVQQLLDIKLNEIKSVWPLLLSNSNPILHIVRMCELLDDKNYPTDEIASLYGGWKDSTSEFAINMDLELEKIMTKLNVVEYRTLLKHYEVNSVESLTTRLKTLPAFKTLLVPMKKIDNKYYLDEDSRYIKEDILYGTCVIKYIADILDIETPYFNKAIKKLLHYISNLLLTDDNKLNVEVWQSFIGYELGKFLKTEITKKV